MAKADYIPNKDGEFLSLLKHLDDKLPGQKAALNIADADIATVTGDASLFEARLAAFDEADTIYSQTSADKTATRAAVEGRLRGIVRRLKTASGYTEAIGQLLRIVGTEDSTDLNTSKPDLSAETVPHGVDLNFTKGRSDGVRIYSRRDGETDFAFLALDSVAPYVDNRALLVAGKPEQRRYKAIYVSGDDEVGNFSDEVVATAAP
jgi:hypothetical protein